MYLDAYRQLAWRLNVLGVLASAMMDADEGKCGEDDEDGLPVSAEKPTHTYRTYPGRNCQVIIDTECFDDQNSTVHAQGDGYGRQGYER